MLRAPSRPRRLASISRLVQTSPRQAVAGADEDATISASVAVTRLPAYTSGPDVDADGRPAGANDSSLIRSSGTSSSCSIWMTESIISFGPQICTTALREPWDDPLQ